MKIIQILWWEEQDSNLRLPPCRGGTLPAELSSHRQFLLPLHYSKFPRQGKAFFSCFLKIAAFFPAFPEFDSCKKHKQLEIP